MSSIPTTVLGMEMIQIDTQSDHLGVDEVIRKMAIGKGMYESHEKILSHLP